MRVLNTVLPYFFPGDGLDDRVSDADPQAEGNPWSWSRPLAPSGDRTARVINSFVKTVRECLADEKKANGCLLRDSREQTCDTPFP
jgi:2,3-bisphosphoglycerate-independent phosphoglycerate mutase